MYSVCKSEGLAKGRLVSPHKPRSHERPCRCATREKGIDFFLGALADTCRVSKAAYRGSEIICKVSIAKSWWERLSKSLCVGFLLHEWSVTPPSLEIKKHLQDSHVDGTLPSMHRLLFDRESIGPFPSRVQNWAQSATDPGIKDEGAQGSCYRSFCISLGW